MGCFLLVVVWWVFCFVFVLFLFFVFFMDNATTSHIQKCRFNKHKKGGRSMVQFGSASLVGGRSGMDHPQSARILFSPIKPLMNMRRVYRLENH